MLKKVAEQMEDEQFKKDPMSIKPTFRPDIKASKKAFKLQYGGHRNSEKGFTNFLAGMQQWKQRKEQKIIKLQD